jgi:hypothetical protein
MNQKEQEILGFMERHHISREQAEELWNQDNSDYMSEEMAEMEKKAKKLPRRYEKDTSKKRKQTEKIRKIDSEKLDILTKVKSTIETISDSEVVQKTETELNFSRGVNDYTLKLIKHRKK